MKWLRILLLSSPLFICVLGLFGLSGNANAITKGYNAFRYSYYGRNDNTEQNTGYHGYDVAHFNLASIMAISARVTGQDSVPSNSNFMTVTAKFNLVTFYDGLSNQSDFLPVLQDIPSISAVSINGNSATFDSGNTQYFVTDWWCDPLNSSSGYRPCRTYTFVYSFIVRGNLPSVINSLAFAGDLSDSPLYTLGPDGFDAYFEYDPNNYVSIDFSNDYNSALLAQQNQTLISISSSLEATNDWLTDTTPPSADTSALGNSAGWLPPGPLDSILNLPIQFIQGIIGVFTNSNTCAPIVLPLGLINYNLEIPCMRPFFELASVNIVWNTVGTIISAILIFHTLKWLYKFVDDTLSFRENNSTMWGGL